MDSILTSIKKMLGITEEYDYFDPDIIMHINTVFSVLTQLGVGPKGGYAISDETAKWSEYDNSDSRLEMLKSYMYLKVKLLFEPAAWNSVYRSDKQADKRTRMAD